MYLLDTDILIWVIRGRRDIVNAVSNLKNKAPTSISTLSVAEIYKNIFPVELIETEEYLSSHIIFPVDVAIAKKGGLYWQEYHRHFSSLNIVDCLIASTANINNLIIVTLNTRHFPMSDIRVADPFKN